MSKRSPKLTEKELRAVEILATHRSLRTTEGPTTEKAINRTTAWGLDEKGLARAGWSEGGERVSLHPMTRQLLKRGTG